MSASVNVEKVENGYVVTSRHGRCNVYSTLDEVFEAVLQTCEGRWHGFGGDSYGKVTIERTKPAPGAPSRPLVCSACGHHGLTLAPEAEASMAHTEDAG